MIAPSRYVFFVCVENRFSSIIAEAIFNTHVPIGWRAESAWVRPGETIDAVAVQLLHEIGIDVAQKKPRRVSRNLVDGAWRLIVFGYLDLCPVGSKEEVEDWPIPGSVGKDGTLRRPEELLAIRVEIERRVLKLIHMIKRAEPNDS